MWTVCIDLGHPRRTLARGLFILGSEVIVPQETGALHEAKASCSGQNHGAEPWTHAASRWALFTCNRCSSKEEKCQFQLKTLGYSPEDPHLLKGQQTKVRGQGGARGAVKGSSPGWGVATVTRGHVGPGRGLTQTD